MEKLPGNLPERNEGEELFETALRFLRDLSSIESLSGQEDEIRKFLIKELRACGVDSNVDEAGNLWVDSSSPEGEILLCAHMDKVGRGCELRAVGSRVRGRLDDAIGLSVILALIKNGLRPSVVFTVEEESDIETFAKGKRVMIKRKLTHGLNYGAQTAAVKIDKGEKRSPKLTVVVDITKQQKPGTRPVIYSSSKTFGFPIEPLKDVRRLLQGEGLKAIYQAGPANDSIEFSFLKDQGVITVEVPVDNYHTENEEAEKKDIVEALAIVKAIVRGHARIGRAKGRMPHAGEKKGPFAL